MTTALIIAHLNDTVEAVRSRLSQETENIQQHDAVIVVDQDGKLIDDLRIVELFVAQADQKVESLIGPPEPVTVGPEASLDEVSELLIANRSTSIVVVDGDHKPIGRIMADDILDDIIQDRSRFRFPRIL